MHNMFKAEYIGKENVRYRVESSGVALGLFGEGLKFKISAEKTAMPLHLTFKVLWDKDIKMPMLDKVKFTKVDDKTFESFIQIHFPSTYMEVGVSVPVFVSNIDSDILGMIFSVEKISEKNFRLTYEFTHEVALEDNK